MNINYKTIFKYQLQITDRQTIQMPISAEILCIQSQNDIPCIWALLNPTDITYEYRTFLIYGTGHVVDKEVAKKDYISTFKIKEGALVYHVFEQQP